MPRSRIDSGQIDQFIYDHDKRSIRVIGGDTTVTDVSGKLSQDVNVTGITISANDDNIETRFLPMKTAVDEASSTVTYVGEAATGTSLASALWRIKRLTQTGTVLLIEWANGNGNFTNIWNNRAALSYS